MGKMQFEHVEAGQLGQLCRRDEIIPHGVHVTALHRTRHLAVRQIRDRRGRDQRPIAVFQGLVDALPHQTGRSLASDMRELDADLRRAVLVNEINDPTPCRRVLGLI